MIFPRPHVSRLPRLRYPLLIGVAFPACLTLLAPALAGLGDPYELTTADLARRAAVHLFGDASLVLTGAENRVPTLGDVGQGELPILLIAASFRLFGLGPWQGRLPLAIVGVLGLVVLWAWLLRMASVRAATFATLVLVTMPLYAVHARTLLGDIVTMVTLLLAFAGLSVLLLDVRPEIPPLLERRPKRWPWLAATLAGLVGGFFCRGALLGVAVPLLAVGLVWWRSFSAIPAAQHRPTLAPAPVGVLTLGAGILSVILAVRGFLVATPSWFDRRLGAAVVLGQPYPTFDQVIALLGPALFPWSAFLPLAFSRLFASTAEQPAADRRLRAVLLLGTGLAYGAYTLLAPRTGSLPYAAVGLLAAAAGLALADAETRGPCSRIFALGTGLGLLLLWLDFQRQPDKALLAFTPAVLPYPDNFQAAGERWLLAATSVVSAALLLSQVVPRRPLKEDHEGLENPLQRWLRRGGFTDAVRVLRRLGTVANGRLLFVVVLLEAALVGAALTLFLGRALQWSFFVDREPPALLVRAILDAWWKLPLIALTTLWLAGVLRRAVDALELRRGWPPTRWLLVGGTTAGLLMTWGYFPALARQLSPQQALATYYRLRQPNEPLGLLGVSGRSPAYYDRENRATSFDNAETALAWLTEEGTSRRWLAVRAAEIAPINSLYRAFAASGGRTTSDHNLPVLNGDGGQTFLTSSVLGATEPNHNPFASFVSTAPPNHAEPAHATFGETLQAIGWELRDSNDRDVVTSLVTRHRYTVRLYYRVLATPDQEWHSFVHLDGQGRRENVDHGFSNYPMRLWVAGDVITDRHTLALDAAFPTGIYTLYYGFFQGEARLAIRGGRRQDDRLEAGDVQVR